MPSNRVSDSKVSVKLHDVVATDGDQAGFLRHTGLAARAGDHNSEEVHVTDMGPPFRTTGRVRADAIGTVPLNDGELRIVKDFIDRHESEHEAVQSLSRSNISQVYCVVPHAAPLEEADGRYVRTRFNCAGFTFEAYRRAGIHLIDELELPQLDLDAIKKAYPNYSALLDNRKFRESLGLIGQGPWKVMLCGYLLHALKRDTAEIHAGKHTVGAGDHIFL